MSGPDLVERLTDAMAKWRGTNADMLFAEAVDALVSKDAYIKAQDAELSTLRSRCETLERERDNWKRRAESCEKHCVPISADGKSVFIDGPGDFEIDYEGWHERALAAEAARDEAVAALERLASPEAFLTSRMATAEETVRMQFADEAVRALEKVLNVSRGPSGRIILEHLDEEDIRSALARATQPSGKEKGE